MTEPEILHLAWVATDRSLLVSDVYSEQRIACILDPVRRPVEEMVPPWPAARDSGEREDVLRRVRRLPEEARLVGDRALFDLGLLGLRSVEGLDIEQPGPLAYRSAGRTFELLAEDRRLRDCFRANRLAGRPLEEEVVFFFLRCSDKFALYAGILRRLGRLEPALPGPDPPAALLAAPALGGAADRKTAPARQEGWSRGAGGAGAETGPDAEAEAGLSLEETLTAYERMILFSFLDLDGLRASLEALVVDQDEAVDALADELELFAPAPRGPLSGRAAAAGDRGTEPHRSVRRPRASRSGPGVHPLGGGGPARRVPRAASAPLSFILVDEVEKAHPQLRTFFLSILGRGSVTDNRGRLLGFPSTMVFSTSNLGYSQAQQRAAPIGHGDEAVRERAAAADVGRDLRRALSPEFANRLRVLHFRRLGRTSAERILDLELERMACRSREVHGLGLELTPAGREERLRRGFSPAPGARRLASVLEAVPNVELSRMIRRDDRRRPGEREEFLERLRELPSSGVGSRDPDLRRPALEMLRARLDYDTVRVHFSPEGGSCTRRCVGETGA